MIVSLEEAKPFLKVDYPDEDILIESLCNAAEMYLKNASGKTFQKTNFLAVLYCKVLINEWFFNRDLMEDGKVSKKVRFTLQSLLLQLQHGEEQ